MAVFTQEVVQVTSKIVNITDNRIVIFVLFYNFDYWIFTQKWSKGGIQEEYRRNSLEFPEFFSATSSLIMINKIKQFSVFSF
jgi:hypothetical protein